MCTGVVYVIASCSVLCASVRLFFVHYRADGSFFRLFFLSLFLVCVCVGVSGGGGGGGGVSVGV